ncbi:hypothetical protein E1B28_010294 [Marasmius oreades]|uniref:Uncharacterized protein n=1 Tax=Marasmius oreades TaxID=181124 RepID=A0A9P7RYA0_9AGAR|nr:uncharacterized protein E1B28_010294 [Marasmius oreades]KAG7091243.1 hypothetical protein E1B28_010294 [Marasmius oreades]
MAIKDDVRTMVPFFFFRGGYSNIHVKASYDRERSPFPSLSRAGSRAFPRGFQVMDG